MAIKETAAQAFASAKKAHKTPVAKQSFVCAHASCGVFAQHEWGRANTLAVYYGETTSTTRPFAHQHALVSAKCEACGDETIFLDGDILYPARRDAPPPARDVPTDILVDYNEARAIVHQSPRGAAALLRLAVEKLCKEIGTTKTDINGAIGELVANGRISPVVQQALDSVRVIGNESVHPGYLDLRDDEATVMVLFNMINFIVHKTITEPKEVAAIYATLPPTKLQGIADRDKAAAPKPGEMGAAGSIEATEPPTS